MRVLKKSVIILITTLFALTVFATKSHAFSKADLQEYMTTEKNFTGTKLIIRDSDKVKLESFFKKTEITDEQASKIKQCIEGAIKYMNEDGAKSPNKMSSTDKKQKLLQYAKDAAAVLNMTVSYDASEERLDIYGTDGKFIDSLYWGIEAKTGAATTEPALVQTGSTNYVYVAVAGVMIVAGITLAIARKNTVKVNA